MRAHKTGSEKRFKSDKVEHGFVAQEVKEVIDNHPEKDRNRQSQV